MKRLFALLTAFAVLGCAHFGPTSSSERQSLAGIYDGRQVIDTQERLTLSLDGTFTYDFIPLGEGGESYGGRWKIKENTVILIGKLESGEEEEFPLEIEYVNGEPRLIYTWESHSRQRATMLVPNVFVRVQRPNQPPEPTVMSVTPAAAHPSRQP